MDESEAAERDDDEAKTGITTTTAADAGVGAAKGAGIGLGLGMKWQASWPSLFLELETRIGRRNPRPQQLAQRELLLRRGVVAGGVTGYLKDQGLSDDAANVYSDQLENGGSLVVVNLPSGGVHLEHGEEIIAKYNGTNVNVY